MLDKLHLEDHGCYLFSSLQSAEECVEYATSARRNNGIDKTPVDPELIKVHAFSAKDRFFAVIFPFPKRSVVAGFWSTPGAGISSRLAEANLRQIDQLTEISMPASDSDRAAFDGPTHDLVRQRIAHYLQRASLEALQPKPSASDIYLYPTGMAAIYKPHSYLLQLNGQQNTTVLFGMAFMNTLTAFEEFGTKYKFFGHGTGEDLVALAEFLRDEYQNGRSVQAIWAEFPANPNLVTPNLRKLRALADEYNVILAVDDTIGSWSNIDIVNLTDILVTSITKSFNGYADVIAGCAILNPTSRKYTDLKALFDTHYIPELYLDDVQAIERNSRDYLGRTQKLNHNARTLVDYLQTCAEDPTSAVLKVHYPTTNPSGSHYQAFLRQSTPELTPGFGCLFSVELQDIETTAAFYDNLNVHNGPHLGAPFTLAFAYTMCAYKNKLDWAAQYGLRPTQIRISVGLEDTSTLLEDFRIAVRAADTLKNERSKE